MQKAQHIGKMVVQLPEDAAALPSVTVAEPIVLRSDRAYLLAGGLGGLGRAVSTWLTERGVRHFVFLSRSADDHARYGSFVQELKELGCSVKLVAGNVCNYADVVQAVSASDVPFAGVLQATMVLRVSVKEKPNIQNPFCECRSLC